MELTEISDRIDILLNAFELPIEVDEYEKSIYLTRAQQTVFRTMAQAFEINGEVSKYLQPFLKDFITSYPIDKVIKESISGSNTVSIVVPNDIFKIVLDKAYLGSEDTRYNNREVKVLASKLADVINKIDNPFRKPNEKEIIRISDSNEYINDQIEFLLPDNSEILRYQCRYLPFPQPIILEELPDTLTIDGETGPLNTKFDDDILEQIIDLAVLLIKQDKTVVNKNV